MNLSMKWTRRTCIQCASKELVPILWIDIKGIPHGSDCHSIAHYYQVVMKCNTCKQLQLEKFDHDCWSTDEEPDMYWWYALESEFTLQFLDLIEECPDALSHECNCNIHQALRASVKDLFSLVRPTYNPCVKAFFCWLTLRENEGLPVLELDEAMDPSEAPPVDIKDRY